jgi:hypothetical protein
VNEDGTVALAVASAWAKDANGKNIRTNYGVNGSTLTQVVDRIAQTGTPSAILAAFGYGAFRCIIGR